MPRGYVTAQTQLGWNPVSGTGTYTAIANVTAASLSGAEKTKIEVTALSDTADEFIGGQVTAGELTFSIAFDPTDTNHQALVTKATTSGTLSDFRVKLPQVNANCVMVNTGGYLSGGALDPQQKSYLKMDFTYTPSGNWTWTYA